jgi:hypothetical protein
MVLGFSDAVTLGRIWSAGGVGMLVGSLLITAWGGPRRRVLGVLGFILLQGVFCAVGALRPHATLVAAAVFGAFFTVPMAGTCSQTIWQSKVPPDVQGRVFSVRVTIAQATIPLAHIVAGPLCDAVFTPLMLPGGALAGSVGRLLGTGPGRGAALLFVVLGAVTVLAAVVGYLHPRLRRVEDELPDHASNAGPGPQVVTA